ncbi:MAG: hypothetical protein OEL75_03855, partial [Kiritimatiellaceae bacterium]|nr:hypothetical protein [Kiritimatiellaceae bacterium]
ATIFQGVARTWRFAVPGDGHSEHVWLRFAKALKTIGYDGPLSIEHEARAVDPQSGLRRTVEFLQKIIGQI